MTGSSQACSPGIRRGGGYIEEILRLRRAPARIARKTKPRATPLRMTAPKPREDKSARRPSPRKSGVSYIKTKRRYGWIFSVGGKMVESMAYLPAERPKARD